MKANKESGMSLPRLYNSLQESNKEIVKLELGILEIDINILRAEEELNLKEVRKLNDTKEESVKKISEKRNNSQGTETILINRQEVLESERNRLVATIKALNTGKSDKNTKKDLDHANQELKKVGSELADYQKLVKKIEDKQEKEYQAKKATLFKIVELLAKNPQILQRALLRAEQNSNQGLGRMIGGAVVISIPELTKLIGSNLGLLASTAASIRFYQKQFALLQVESVQENSFFRRLALDPETMQKFKGLGGDIMGLITTVAPSVVSIGLNNLSRLENASQRVKKHAHGISKLPEIDGKIQVLRSKESLDKKGRNELHRLEQERSRLRGIVNGERIAAVITGLKEQDVDSSYINAVIMPQVLDTLKVFLDDSEKLAAVASNVMELMVEKDPKRRKVLQESIIENIPEGSITEMQKTLKLLVSEKDQLMLIAGEVARNNKELAGRFGVSPELLERSLPKLTDMLDYLSSDPKRVQFLLRQAVDIVFGENDVKKLDVGGELLEGTVKHAVAVADNALPGMHDFMMRYRDSQVSTDPVQDVKVMDSVARLLGNDQLKDSVSKLGQHLLDSTDQIKDSSKNVPVVFPIVARTFKETGTDIETLQDAVSIGVGVVGKFMHHMDDVEMVVKGGVAIAANAEKKSKKIVSPEEWKSANNFLAGAVSILDDKDIQQSVRTKIPQYLSNHKQDLVTLVSSVSQNSETIQESLDNFGIDSQLIKETTSVGLDLATHALPEIYDFAKKSLRAVSFDDDLSIDADQRLKVAQHAVEILDNQNLRQAFHAVGEHLLDNSDSITKISGNMSEKLPQLHETLEDLELDADDFKDAVSVGIEGAGNLLRHTDDLHKAAKGAVTILSNVKKAPDIDTIEQNGQGAENFVIGLVGILENKEIEAVIAKRVPEYLLSHKAKLVKAISKVLQNSETIQESLDDLDIDSQLLEETVDLGVDLAAQTLPHLYGVLSGALKDPKAKGLILQLQSLISKPTTQGALVVVDTLGAMFAENPKLAKAFSKDLPKIMNENMDRIAPLVYRCLSQNGSILMAKLVQRVITLAPSVMPYAMKAVECYSSGSYTGFLSNISSIIFNRKVMAVVLRTLAEKIEQKIFRVKERNRQKKSLGKLVIKEGGQAEDHQLKDRADQIKGKYSLDDHLSTNGTGIRRTGIIPTPIKTEKTR